MRPQILFSLFEDISNLVGVGAKTSLLFKKLAGDKVVNIIYHLPTSVVDRRQMPEITKMQEGQVVTSVVQIEQHILPSKPNDKKSPYKVRCYNETGFLTLVFFGAYPNYLKKQLPVGAKLVISGTVDKFGGGVQITHPDYIANVSELEKIRKVEAVYPMTAGVGRKTLLKVIDDALKRIKPLHEWIEPSYLKKNNWDSWANSLKKSP